VERKKVDKSKGAAFCRDKPDQKVEHIVVDLGNHEKKKGSFLKGNYEVEKKASCCGQQRPGELGAGPCTGRGPSSSRRS
jgi:hypothetical protein